MGRGLPLHHAAANVRFKISTARSRRSAPGRELAFAFRRFAPAESRSVYAPSCYKRSAEVHLTRTDAGRAEVELPRRPPPPRFARSPSPASQGRIITSRPDRQPSQERATRRPHPPPRLARGRGTAQSAVEGASAHNCAGNDGDCDCSRSPPSLKDSMPPRLAIAGLTASCVMRGLDPRIQDETGLGKSQPSQLGRPDQVRA